MELCALGMVHARGGGGGTPGGGEAEGGCDGSCMQIAPHSQSPWEVHPRCCKGDDEQTSEVYHVRLRLQKMPGSSGFFAAGPPIDDPPIADVDDGLFRKAVESAVTRPCPVADRSQTKASDAVTVD
eukprot:SAG31_NODE_5029_length_2794_cov_1.742115_2_plen_126_part_00